MKLKKSFFIAIAISITGVFAWECYWRSKGYSPNLDDNKDLWAVQRARVKNLGNDDFIFIGSSRVLFDIQLNEWEKETGKRPLMLACAGSSPLPVFHDLVEKTNYTGTIIVGVTPTLFFSTTFPEARPWKRPQTRIDYFYNRTYAQCLNHLVSIPFQKNLVLMSTSEEQWSDDIDLKTLLRNIKIGNRVHNDKPPFYNFSSVDLDRNVTLSEKTATDTAFANTIKKVWAFFGKNAPPPDKESTMAFFIKDANKFMERGGKLILLRCPSTGGFRMGESKVTPRDQFWDVLIQKSNVKGYHYEDYEQLKHFDCPEWSHLSLKDAKLFTSELAKIMIQEGLFTKPKTQ